MPLALMMGMLQVLPNATLPQLTHSTPLSSHSFLVASLPTHYTDLPKLDFEITVITDPAGLRNRIGAWKRLAETAIEPNVFYEWWNLLPALEHLVANKQKVAVIVVEAPLRVHPDGRRILCGLFPVQFRRNLRGLPVSSIEMWQHDYCYLTTPLVRCDVARETINAFLDWLDTGKSRLWHLPQVSSFGPFDILLTRLLAGCSRLRVSRDRHYRATLVRRGDAEQAMQIGVSKKRRHEIRRMQRKLESIGTLIPETFDTSCELTDWIEDFLRLESSGWKGRQGTAISRSTEQRNFFESMIVEAACQSRLEMIRLQLDGRTIALKINLLVGDGAFCFKIAYDETLARFSPGVLLEVSNIQWMHDRPQAKWMDSCAVANHSMIETLWPDRRCIESAIVPNRRRGSTLLAAMVLMLRAIKMSVSGNRNPKTQTHDA